MRAITKSMRNLVRAEKRSSVENLKKKGPRSPEQSRETETYPSFADLSRMLRRRHRIHRTISRHR